MKQEIAWRRYRMARPRSYFLERVQLGRPRVAEQAVPCFGADPHHTGETRLQIAEFHGAEQRQEGPHRTTEPSSDGPGPGLLSQLEKSPTESGVLQPAAD
jgi:hypothetical protein